MGSRVNVKFVVLLSTLLVLVAGGAAGLALMVLLKSAEDLAARGDEMMAAREYKAAEVFYSKAVNKEPYNSEYLIKWRDALHNWVPETDRELLTEYGATYMPIHAQLALSDNRIHPEYQLDYVRLLAQSREYSHFNRGVYDSLIAQCDSYILPLQTTQPDSPVLVQLRRERGLAWARIASERLELTPEQMALAEEDLSTALAADPADIEVLQSLVTLKTATADRVRELGRHTEAAELENAANKLIDESIAANGAESVAGAQALMLKTESSLRAQRSAAARQLGSGALPEIKRIAEEHHASTAAIAETLMAADPVELDADVVWRLFVLERQTDGTAMYEHSLKVVERALSAHNDDPLLTLFKADILAGRGDAEQAVQVLGKLLDMPRGALSEESVNLVMRKQTAASRQTDVALEAATRAGSDTVARDAWLARAKESRGRLVQMVSESEPRVKFYDARIALLAGDLVTAQQKLDEYNKGTNNTNTEGLWLAAEVAQRLGQLGNAQLALERLIELDPTQAGPHAALANVLVQLNRLDAARDHLLIAKKGLPDNEAILERIRRIEVQLGIIEADDPVEGALFAAHRRAAGTESEIADVAGAVEMLRQAIAEHGPDQRLYTAIARYQLLHGNLEASAAAASEGLTHFPDDEELKKYVIAASGSVDELVAMIAQSDRSEVEKQFAIFQTLMRAGRTEEAEQALIAAEKADPNSPLLLEVLFGRAYSARDVAKAREIAERAASVDADRLNGLSYRARLLMLEGQEVEALAALDEAVRRNPNSASLWRLRANLQMELGRSLDAIQSYEHALSIRPDDLQSINDYTQALVKLNRLDQALELTRRSEVYGRSSPDFMEMLLTLEAKVGNKPGARDRREAILEIRPDDVTNRLGLGSLYITLGQWDEARALIEETRTKFGESIPLTELDARWYAERNELENARRVYAAAIANAAPDQRLPIYAALAEFLLGRGQESPAIIVLQQASRHQPKGTHPIDRILGSALMRFGREREALDVFKGMLADGDDEEYSITKSAAEAAIRSDRLSEAESLLATVPNGEADVTVVLLRASIVLARGEASQARAMLDSAVEEWPNDHRVWVKRAQAEALSKDLLPDALADIDRALELRPDLAENHAMRADLLVQLGRHDEAIEELAETVRLNPLLEQLRVSLLFTLLQQGREAEALTIASEWFALHPRDVGLRARVAEMFVQARTIDPAISIYQEAVAIEQRPELVQRATELLLGSQPPKLPQAERLLSDAKNVVTSTPSLLLARAFVFARTNRVEAAHNDCLSAYQLTPRDAESMDRWYVGVRRAYTDTPTLLTFLRTLGQQPGAGEWAAVFSARALLDNPPTAKEGLTTLQKLIPQTRDVHVRYAALRALSGNRYRAKDFDAAVAAWKEALTIREGDWQVENNLAYVLATDMGRPADALPYAEAAAKHGANSAEAHDTLGAVYLSLGRPADAIAPLEAAVRAARSVESVANYKIRLAQARLASGDRAGAKDLVAEVQSWVNRGQELDDHYKTIFDELRQALGEE